MMVMSGVSDESLTAINNLLKALVDPKIAQDQLNALATKADEAQVKLNQAREAQIKAEATLVEVEEKEKKVVELTNALAEGLQKQVSESERLGARETNLAADVTNLEKDKAAFTAAKADLDQRLAEFVETQKTNTAAYEATTAKLQQDFDTKQADLDAEHKARMAKLAELQTDCQQKTSEAESTLAEAKELKASYELKLAALEKIIK